jgi:hypothetical protein
MHTSTNSNLFVRNSVPISDLYLIMDYADNRDSAEGGNVAGSKMVDTRISQDGWISAVFCMFRALYEMNPYKIRLNPILICLNSTAGNYIRLRRQYPCAPKSP